MTRKSRKLSAEVIDVATQEMDEVLDRAATRLSEEDAELLRRVVDSYSYLSEIIADKNTSLKRLRKLMFGSSTEKTKNVVDDGKSRANAGDAAEDDTASGELNSDGDSSKSSPKPKQKRQGHGRISADQYQGADQMDVKHDHLSEGDSCPDCNGGRLYEKTPRVIVRIVGQPPLGATVYRLQKLRCHLCGKLFTANEPNSALGEAINYLLKRWDEMTLFLREPGAPLDNNIAENALKRAIIHRKNSLFYRTKRGAQVGDIFMSLIYTCELNGANPFDYLNQLQRNVDQVVAEPNRWWPWNYAQAMPSKAAAA